MNPLRTVVERSLSSYIQAVSGERNTVGAMAFTVMPVSPHSQPSALVTPSIADFDAQYAVQPAGWPNNPRADDMKMTLPPRFCASICLPAARAISQDWVTLTSMTSMNVSGG